MKKIATVLFAIIIGALSMAQSPNLPAEKCLIVKKNKKQIKGARLWNISTTTLEYEKEGSLHDLPTDDISIIKTDDEIISFDIEGKMLIRPYDLLFTYGDTIKCVITRISMSHIHYVKQKGNKKYDLIAGSDVQEIIHVSDTLVFHEILDQYYEIITSQQRLVAEKKAAKAEIAKTESYVKEEETNAANIEEEKTLVGSEPKDAPLPDHPIQVITTDTVQLVREQEDVDTNTDVENEDHEPTRKFYADKYNNNDLILMTDGRAVICRIDKVSTNRIYYHITQPGPDPDSYVDRSDVLKYVNTPAGHRNIDMIVLNSGNSFACKIREVKDGHIHYLIYKRGPETRASVDLKYVKSYEKQPIAEFTESELKSARTASSSIKPTLPASGSGPDSKVNSGIPVGQFFAGTGAGLIVGGIGFVIGSVITDEFTKNTLNMVGYTIGATLGATAMVAVVGLASKNTKSNLGATLLGGFIGALGGALVMNQLSEIDSPQGQIVGALAGGTLPAIGAMIGHHATKEPKRSNFSAQISYNRVGLTYNF